MAFEIAFLLFLAVVIIAGLITMAKPLTEVFAEKTRFKYRMIGSETEKLLKEKVSNLEGELLALKQQLTSLQETVDYLGKELEAQQNKGATIKVQELHDR